MNQSNEEKLAKMKEILTEDYVKELFELETPAEVQESLRGKGVEFSEEEIVAIRNIIATTIENGVEVLSDEELENISGGNPYLIAIGVLGFLIVGTIVCTCVLGTRW